ncbi:hypothetical protein L198_04456 [Cryptococcus wingfieldii CBS 7118]|uniref:NuA3 HAT complex component NTO1 n=1 Tax=Cryptococcus wingfieldii CBS 7118 TaxID=1295528 RepID=A0A1E3J4P7_9TREE|nr:hypothetical protein L198_04456 [Cryptococcus wingfieldii CBS 7118]ODN95838.1 hypothetical protein L198_04456 [Cryptococcus wingfieldii CBS 7118]
MGPDTAVSLPTVSYRIIEDDNSLLQPAGVQSEQSRSYGFNDYSDFERPEHYIRYIEPIESELSVQVEYDMDEQDQVWLDALNVERKKDQCGPISYEVFEIIMDKLEKEWFNLSKRIPKPDHSLPAEDSKCSVCDDGEGENSNAIVFCDGCNLAVHQDCYGVPYIPEGQWLCRKCTVSPENPVSCVFCPNEGGAFKQTTTGHWAHLLCAIWIPETSLGNAIYMEPVEGLEHIPKSRWRLVCSLCKEKVGACIQCDNRNCFTAFHPTCARQMGLLQTMKSLTTDGVLRAYCHRHLPVEEADVLQGYGEGRDEEWDARSNLDRVLPPPAKAQGKARSHKKGASNRCIRTPKAPIIIAPLTKKSAQAHSKSFRPGPPVIPKMIVNRILDYVGKVQVRKKPAVVEMISRYWSLKREMRRGAPLLKRLHLEPWTASTTAKTQTEAEKTLKLKFLQLVRNDLEKVRMLAELVRKREKEKLRQVQVIKNLVDGFIFPNGDKMRVTLEKISALDRRELFLNPVTEIEAPDYFKIIKEPRCWLYIDDKLERNLYIDVAEFKANVTLVMDNAMTYNGPDTPFYRAAEKLKKSAEPLLAELDDISAVYQAALPPHALETVNAGEKWPVGDLEASLARLSPFLNPTPVPSRPDAPQDLLSSLFATELAPPKPPTPSPSPAPISRKGPTVEERNAKWRVREAEDREQGLVRATRNRQKLELDFAKEAGLGLASPGSGVAKDGEGEALMIGTAIAQNDEGKTVRRSTRGGEITESPKFMPRKRDRRPKVNPTPAPTPAPTSALASAPITATPTQAAPQSATRASSTSLSSTHPDLKPLSRPQQGVAGLEAIPILSDRERREQELALALELEGTDVGGLDQFKRFNVGWVLPEGKPEEVEEVSSQAQPAAGPSKVIEPTPALADDESDLSPPPPARSQAGTPQAGTPRTTRKRGGVVYVPDMDLDPEDMLRRRTSRPKGQGKGKEKTVETPLPDQVDIPQAGVEEGSASIHPSRKGKLPPPPAKTKRKVKDPFPPGTLVWAKIYSFPHFPAEIVDLDDPDDRSEVPDPVLAEEAAARKAAEQNDTRVWLVRFYDSSSSYGWIAEDKLDDLGESDEVDGMYLSGKMNRFKSQHMKKMCKKAYREAMASMESSDEEKL